MESAEQPIQDLYKKVGGFLKQSPESVNPEAPHEELKRNLQAVIGSTFEEHVGGASSSVNDRSTKGRVVTLIGDLRRKLKAAYIKWK